MHYQLIPLYVLAAVFGLYTLWGIITYCMDNQFNDR